MTKTSETAVVPTLDGDRLARLAQALDMRGVVAASLIGSQATGRAGPLSDVDVGVWTEPNLSRDQQHELSLRLLNAACDALGTSEVDLVVLNHAPPLLRHRAMRDGVRVIERDHSERVRLETRALLDYLDTAPLRATIARNMQRRIEEGRFGRR